MPEGPRPFNEVSHAEYCIQTFETMQQCACAFPIGVCRPEKACTPKT